MYRKKHRTRSNKPVPKRKRINVHAFAEVLKKRMTKAEIKLWAKLRTAMVRWNVIFEPQGVVGGRFIADFVCRDKRLIIELDGSIHRLSRVRAKDKYRTAVLTKLGYTIVRFSNTLVHSNHDYVLHQIKLLIED
jgi:very-short-patch-repair endonuclease